MYGVFQRMVTEQKEYNSTLRSILFAIICLYRIQIQCVPQVLLVSPQDSTQ